MKPSYILLWRMCIGGDASTNDDIQSRPSHHYNGLLCAETSLVSELASDMEVGSNSM